MEELNSEETSLLVYILQRVLWMFETNQNGINLIKTLARIDELFHVDTEINRAILTELIAKI